MLHFCLSNGSSDIQTCHTREPRGNNKFGSYQSPVLQVLSQKAVVIQGIFGFPCHPVDWPFVHLVLDSSKQHVKGLPNRILHRKEGVSPERNFSLETQRPEQRRSGTEDSAAKPQQAQALHGESARANDLVDAQDRGIANLRDLPCHPSLGKELDQNLSHPHIDQPVPQDKGAKLSPP